MSQVDTEKELERLEHDVKYLGIKLTITIKRLSQLSRYPIDVCCRMIVSNKYQDIDKIVQGLINQSRELKSSYDHTCIERDKAKNLLIVDNQT
jgi:hypothetical protein